MPDSLQRWFATRSTPQHRESHCQTLLEISQKGFGVVGVIDDASRLIGVVTDGDLRRHMDGLLDRRARDVMTAGPATILPGALAEEAVRVMEARRITCLFAVETDGAIAGILKIHDCLRAGVV